MRVFLCVCVCVPRETQIEAGEQGMWRRAVLKKKEKKDLVSLVKRKESMYVLELLVKLESDARITIRR